MDIFKPQYLIKEGRIVALSDIDPTKAYLQLGLFQDGNRQSNAANADTYKPYVIPISALVGTPFVPQFRNYIGVDPVYGNDLTAVTSGIYNPNAAFKTVAAAIAASTAGDVLVLYPGIHNTAQITNPTCKFYLYEGATLINTTGSVFVVNAGFALEVAGHGKIITGGFVTATPTILLIGGTANIECDLIMHTGAFWGPLFMELGAIATVRCKSIVAGGTLNGAVFLATGAELILNAEDVSFNWMAYNIGANCKFTANVKKTISFDAAIPFSFGNSFILATNDATNVDVRFTGDFFSSRTTDDANAGSGAIVFWNNSGGNIIVNGQQSFVRLQNSVVIYTSPTGKIIQNTDIINTQGGSGIPGNGGYQDSGTFVLKGKLTSGGDPLDYALYYAGTANLILDDGILIANPVAQTIVSPAPITYKCYTGFANGPIHPNATNSIPGTAVIISGLIE